MQSVSDMTVVLLPDRAVRIDLDGTVVSGGSSPVREIDFVEDRTWLRCRRSTSLPPSP